MSKFLNKLLVLFTIFVLLFLQFSPQIPLPVAEAAIGWVGEMDPRPGVGSPTRLVLGDASGLNVYLQVWKGGTTDSAGQGSGITCSIWWANPSTTPDWAAIPMTYIADVGGGSNDLYHGEIPTGTLPVGSYEYTARCSDDGGSTFAWQNDGNGTLEITGTPQVPFSRPITNMEPGQASLTTVTQGDVVNISVDFYSAGITDAQTGSGHPNVACRLRWDGSDGAANGNWGDSTMTFLADVGLADRYQLSINTALLTTTNAIYGFTSYCNDGVNGDRWYGDNNRPGGGDGNGRLEVLAPPNQAISNMQPPAGSTTTVAPGDSFTVTVDFYQNNVTNTQIGAGNPGVACFLHWDGANGEAGDGTWGDTPMTFLTDAGVADRYRVIVNTGLLNDVDTSYGYTTRCDYNGQQFWYGSDGTLFLGTTQPPNITNLQPPTGTNTIVPLGDTSDLTLTVDFYYAGVTDADANAVGAGVACQLWWDGHEGLPNNDWNADDMVYAGADNNGYDVFAYTIPSAGTTLPGGTYGYTARCIYGGQTYWYGDFNDPNDGTIEVFEPSNITQQRALWVDRNHIAWRPANSGAIVQYQLLSDLNGSLVIPPNYDATNGVNLTQVANLNVADYPKFPNAHTWLRFQLPGSVDDATMQQLLRSELAIAGYSVTGELLEATGLQLQGVLDAFYSRSEVETYLGGRTLGVSYMAGAPQLHLWAPTAQDVDVHFYADPASCSSGTAASVVDMDFDAASGVWSASGNATWTYLYYRYQVDVYSPYTGVVEANLVTDPYSVSLSANNYDLVNAEPLNDQCSQVVDLYNDASLKPAGWDSLGKPTTPNPEDITVYELHVRDFSIFAQDVPATDRGTFRAFTHTGSSGMQHLIRLANAGLTHIHLLPVADSGTMVERRDQQQLPDYGAMEAAVAADPASQLPQQEIADVRLLDGFNWGYETQHFGVPEGAYSTNPNTTSRILEFREMVQSLNSNGLRVVIDVVYNHSYRAEQESGSVLDQIVPGYYQRLDGNGNIMNSSCCPDTASEFDMMEKLIIDTALIWANAYKVDGLRFDLMNLHTRQNALNVRAALDTVPHDVYMYGEGWDFGSLRDKGFGNHPNADYRHATQFNMAGSSIGTFNDRLRDAVHGGGFFDNRRDQGFTTGEYYDPNGENDSSQTTLRYQQDRVMVGLAGSIQSFSFTDRNNNVTTAVAFDGSGYALDPADTINYASKHDNETLFDLSVFKLNFPETPLSDYVRVQNLGVNVIMLSQGIPFFDAGVDMLHSKSMDRNSYDSGDWFNRLDFTYTTNNFGVGLPPAWDNSSRWSIMEPRLRATAIHPGTAEIQRGVENFEEFLQIRYSSPLFRLTTGTDITERVQFYNVGNNSLDGLVVMSLADGTPAGTNTLADLHANVGGIWVLFNANDQAQNFTVEQLINDNTMQLHPVLVNSTDPIVRTASFDPLTGIFSLPARTTAVFLTEQAPIPPSTIDFVGLMWNRGGSSQVYPIGTATTQNVYVQVYEDGVTPGAGAGAGIECFAYWGAFGDEANWTSTPMTFQGDQGNNDEYVGTLNLSGLGVGTYGYTAYCKKTTEEARKWRQNILDYPNNIIDEGLGIISIMPASAPPPGTAYVHLFEWQWSDVAQECSFLAEAGYNAVQVSPPQEHVILNTISTDPWWTRYQPVSYILNSRGGTAAEFQSMVNTCQAAGVNIIVDAVINHMSGQSDPTQPGTNGTVYQHLEYPGLYGPDDFHACGTTGSNPDDANNIFNYSRRYEVQECELLNLADLDTSSELVQADIQAYLQALINMGVWGFRIDAAKHIFTHDITEILGGLSGDFYVFQEVIGSASEPVKAEEYVINGDVTEFAYSRQIGNIFNCGETFGNLQNIASGKLPSDAAVVFTDNHDNQRGHGAGGPCILDHRDGDDLYNLGNVFMLAYPYGYPQVMSSYWWDDGQAGADNYGPPATPLYTGTTLTGCNSTDWVCEHRRLPMVAMVEFRAVTAGEPVNNWQTFGSPQQIAFGRGTTGFVAINRTNAPFTATFQTSMPEGTYCDALTGGLLPDGSACVGTVITVDASGQIVNQAVPGLTTADSEVSAFAIHERTLIGYVPPQIVSTEPTEGGTIATDGAITVTFNKPVNVVSNAFTLVCGAQTISLTSNPPFPALLTTSLVLTPTSPLPANTTCTLTASAAGITDVTGAELDGNADGNDGDNFVLTFQVSNTASGGGNNGGLAVGGEIVISNGDLILDAGEFIVVVPADLLTSRGRLLIPVGGEAEIMFIFRNPKSIPLTQVVISSFFETRLDVLEVQSASIGRTVLSGNSVYLDAFQLLPAQQERMIVRIRVNNRAKPGDIIPVQAALESPDASIHFSNTLEILVTPGSLPATGETPDKRPYLLMLGLLLAVITLFTYQHYAARRQVA